MRWVDKEYHWSRFRTRVIFAWRALTDPVMRLIVGVRWKYRFEPTAEELNSWFQSHAMETKPRIEPYINVEIDDCGRFRLLETKYTLYRFDAKGRMIDRVAKGV